MEKELEELESTRGNSVTKKEEGKEERKGVGGAYRYFKQLCKSSEEYYEQFDPEELKEKR